MRLNDRYHHSRAPSPFSVFLNSPVEFPAHKQTRGFVYIKVCIHQPGLYTSLFFQLFHQFLFMEFQIQFNKTIKTYSVGTVQNTDITTSFARQILIHALNAHEMVKINYHRRCIRLRTIASSKSKYLIDAFINQAAVLAIP